MKKFLSFTLCLVLLITAFCVLTNGAEKPAATKELPLLTAFPTDQDMISVGLLAPNIYSLYTFGPDTIDEANQYELSRYLKYGISIMGVSGLERTIGGAVDGYWTTGNTGSVLVNSSAKQYGAFSWYNNGKLYNHLGETGKQDSIYQVVMTMNFGQLASINSFGYASPNLNNAFQAADIYVSSNGEDWTLVGGYDRPTTRMNGSDYALITENAPTDKNEKNNVGFLLFDMGNVEAQFVRVCATCNAGKTNPVDPTVYNDYSNSSTEKSAFREMVVFGKKLDKPNTVTATEKAEQNTTEAAATTTSTPISQIPVKPKETTAATTEEATTAAAAATTATATTAAPAEKSGCGSYLGASALVMLAVTAGGAVITSTRRKRK